MNKINIALLLTLAMADFSALAMHNDDNDFLNTANRQLINDAETAAGHGLDLYELLGVNETATQEEIKKARRIKLRENHSDKGGDQTAFKALNNATEILKCVPARLKYDATRTAKIRAAQKAREEQERMQRAAEAEAERAKKEAEERTQYLAQQAEWQRVQEAEREKESAKRARMKEARKAQLHAYRQELRSMSLAQAAEKFNFYTLLGITPHDLELDRMDDRGFLEARLLSKKRDTTINAWTNAERLKQDEEFNEQLEYAYDTLRFESKRKEYAAALKRKHTRKHSDAEEAEESTDDRPSKRRQTEAQSSFFGNLCASISQAITRMF